MERQEFTMVKRVRVTEYKESGKETDKQTQAVKRDMKLIVIAGARPNFMKIAPMMKALHDNPHITTILVHTGQHYDLKMSGQFFEELNIPMPEINLEVGSASQAVQTARIMERFEEVCLTERPDAILVVGDVTSTAACSLVASKLGISVIQDRRSVV